MTRVKKTYPIGFLMGIVIITSFIFFYGNQNFSSAIGNQTNRSGVQANSTETAETSLTKSTQS